MLARPVIFSLLLCLLTAVGSAVAETEYAPDRVIIKFRNTAGPAATDALRAASGATLERRFRTGAQVWRLGGLSVEEAIARFSADPNVLYAEPDYVIALDQTDRRLPNDPRFDELYAMDNFGQTGGTTDADIDAPEAWTIRTDCDVLIGVIDTGADWMHEDLAANIWTNPGEIPGNRVDDDNNGFVDDVRGWDFFNDDNDPMDDNRHGTHVSGTIAAVGDNGVGISGVCWRANIVPIKVLDENGRGTISRAIEGIEYAELIGCAVTNNSWGSDAYSRALEEALAAHAQTDLLFVAAAGNTARDTDFFPHYPADHEFDNIISVANTNDDDEISATSSFGAQSVDLAAPGSSIRSLVLDSKYGILSGTSMATPHVTGAVALIMSEAPLTRPEDVKAHLLASVDPLPSLAGKAMTAGRLNLHTALATLDAVAPSRVSHLRVAEKGSNTVTLEWIAPYDDAGDPSSGAASAYEIRFDEAPIKPHTFDAATPVAGAPRPGPPGTLESYRVGGLDVKRTYFFAIRALDERLNASEVSSAAPGHTKDAPQAAISRDAFAGSALTGARAAQTLRVSNVGKGTLDFEFSAATGEWARVEPRTGTVRARETAELTVVLDASGLAGGAYDTDIVMETNDPAAERVELPARLAVTSAPDVVVSDAEVGFGELFVGASASRELAVTNRGDEVLFVSAVELVGPAHEDGFAAGVDPFALAPQATKVIPMGFAPKRAEAAAGQLRIESNDPDAHEVTVRLTGKGLPPPDIAVAPAGLELQLETGETTTRTVTIRNDGEADLTWALTSEDAPVGGMPARTATEGPYRDLTGVRILYDAAHRNLHWFNYNTMFVDLRSRGAEITVSYEPFTADLLEPFDVVWIAEWWDPVVPEERDALTAWVRAGGGVLLEGDYDLSVPTFNELLSVLFSGIVMSPEHGETGITNNIVPHETTRDVTNVFLSRVTSTLGEVRPPAQTLIYDTEGVANTAWSRAGAGRIYMMADQNLANHRMGRTGNRILGNRIIDWLALGVSWMDAQPAAGTIPPGEAQQLSVSVDAAGLGGSFGARIVVASNDPDEGTVVVPVRLDAIAAPDIVVTPGALEYPPTAIERSTQRTVTVGNVGAAELEVTTITSSHDDFTAWPAALRIPPGGVETVTVTYRPTAAGPVEAVVAITSNDPDGGSITVAVSAEAFVGTPGSVTLVAGAGTALRSWNVDTADDEPAAVFASGLARIEQVVGFEDGEGVTYNPRLPGSSNTLERLDHLRAYWIELSEPESITVEGFVVDPQTPIPLAEGWNTISYLPTEADEVAHALASIMDNLTWVIGHDGESTIYLPTIPDQYNTLKELKPSFGYFVKMAAPDTLIYPDTVFAAPAPASAAGAESGPDRATPLRTGLHSNVPNPFNPVTTIRYDVADNARVSLVVYDVRGRRVRTLVDRVQPPGRYAVEWDGRNDRGRSVATGVYFYRLVAGGFEQSRKMVLLK